MKKFLIKLLVITFMVSSITVFFGCMGTQCEHTYDSGVVLISPTCDTNGQIEYTCTKCGQKKTEDILASGHTYATTWSSDENYHWHNATCTHTDEKKDKSQHRFNSGVEKKATCIEEGSITYTCLDCGYKKIETIRKTNHNYSDTLSYDENTHFYKCTKCDVKKGVTEHIWVQGKVIKPATCLSKGTAEFSCICGATKVDEIDCVGHSFGETLLHDNDTHFYQCSVCGEKKEVSEHIWVQESVIKSATCTSKGSVKFTCACGATKIEETNALGHNFNGEYEKDDNYHWLVCSRCGIEDTKSLHNFSGEGKLISQCTDTEHGKEEVTCSCGKTKQIDIHKWEEEGTTIKEASPTEEGEILYKCLIPGCSKTEVRKVSYSGHIYSNEYSYDETGHWHACISPSHEGCDSTTEKEAHVFDSFTITKQPTCTEEGEKVSKCACGYEKTEKIEAKGHTYGSEYYKEGDKHWQVCTVCKEPSEKVSHIYVNSITKKQPTCTEKGIKERYCICGEVNTVEIECIPHNYVVSNLTKEGDTYKLEYDCSMCHKKTTKVLEEDFENRVIEALYNVDISDFTLRYDGLAEWYKNGGTDISYNNSIIDLSFALTEYVIDMQAIRVQKMSDENIVSSLIDSSYFADVFSIVQNELFKYEEEGEVTFSGLGEFYSSFKQSIKDKTLTPDGNIFDYIISVNGDIFDEPDDSNNISKKEIFDLIKQVAGNYIKHFGGKVVVDSNGIGYFVSQLDFEEYLNSTILPIVELMDADSCTIKNIYDSANCKEVIDLLLDGISGKQLEKIFKVFFSNELKDNGITLISGSENETAYEYIGKYLNVKLADGLVKIGNMEASAFLSTFADNLSVLDIRNMILDNLFGFNIKVNLNVDYTVKSIVLDFDYKSNKIYYKTLEDVIVEYPNDLEFLLTLKFGE